MALSRSLRKVCVCGAALLMLAGTGAGVASNVVPANARRVRTHRVYRRRTRRAPRRRSSRRRSVKRAVRRTKRARARKSSEKNAPWKRSWNKYLRDYSVTTWSTDKIFSPHMAKLRDTRNPGNPVLPGNRKTYNNFYNHQVRKNAINNERISYPQFYQLAAASGNMTYEELRKAYALMTPVFYNHRGTATSMFNDNRNAEMFANAPLHGYTRHMIHEWYSVATPATNGQRILNSFKRYMRRTHQHPNLRVQGHNYVYNGKDFVPSRGKNGYGQTYEFNPKTNKYRLVSTKKVEQKINQARMNLEGQLNGSTDQAVNSGSNTIKQPQTVPMYSPTDQAFLNEVENDPVLTQNTKDTVKKLLIMPPVQSVKTGLTSSAYKNSSNNVNSKGLVKNPAKVYKEASKSKRVSKPQQMRLSYISGRMSAHQRALRNAMRNKNRQTAQQDIMILTEKGAFNGMSGKQYSEDVEKLCANPKAMAKALKKYQAGTGITAVRNPKKVVKEAQKANRNGSLEVNGKEYVTNDKINARDIALLKEVLAQIANDSGAKTPAGSKVTITL